MVGALISSSVDLPLSGRLGIESHRLPRAWAAVCPSTGLP
ncbi:hypothetical protein PspLS_11169 [Pyricularia sp. CBS 133598]|nr:hypothetical protein PspLS_11169 [Pyricularia sp. CBS 133598]